MPHPYGNGIPSMQGQMPGVNPPQPASWGFVGPVPFPLQQKPGEGETDFEEDGDATDSDEAGTGSEEDGETESEDENTNHNRVSPLSGHPPGIPFAQQPARVMQPQQPHARPGSGSPSSSFTPEFMAEIKELVHRESESSSSPPPPPPAKPGATRPSGSQGNAN